MAPQGRKSEHQPWLFGMRFALLGATWAVDRLPGALRLLRVKPPPADQTAHALLRELVRRFVPPPWATRVLVAGAAAEGSPAHLTRVLPRDAADPARQWGVGCAMARPWQTVAGKAIKDWVTPVPRTFYQRTLVPRLPGATGRKTFWV